MEISAATMNSVNFVRRMYSRSSTGALLKIEDTEQSNDEQHGGGRPEYLVGTLKSARLDNRQRRLEQHDFGSQGADYGERSQVMEEGMSADVYTG